MLQTRFIPLAVGLLLLRLTPLWAADRVGRLHVLPGFEVQAVASPPLVERPMAGGFDDRGRLFVAESAGLNLDFDKLAANPPNFIRMLVDTDGDGIFDKSTIFADRMTFPSGALWHDGALYVCSAPALWKLEDTDNDGVADKRTQIVSGFGSIGNGADLHGPFLGPDGWLYFCDGRNGHKLTLGDGTQWTGKAAAVYRCRTDGSGLEIVFGGGMDNPVEAVFLPTGEMLVSCNLVNARPQRLDGILFGIEGGVYPHDEACVSEFPRTGDLLKPVGDLGWVAVSGLVRYQGNALGDDFDGNLFSAQFNPHRVQRHKVAHDGGGFRISSEDFLTCDDPDFHPTDVLEDRDGSLLVIDTGGWFRIGCPASQVEKPSILGGIYRVRRTGAHNTNHPTTAPVDPDIRLRAIQAAGLARDPKAVGALVHWLADGDLAEMRDAATALGRIGDKSATAPLLAALQRTSDPFCQHAIIFALIRIADRSDTAVGLSDPSPTVRRGALIALDQMKGGSLNLEEVTPLLAVNDPDLRREALKLVMKNPQWVAKLADQLRLNLDALLDVPLDVLPDAWNEAIKKALAAREDDTVRQAVEVVRARRMNQFDQLLVQIARDDKRTGELRVAALAAVAPRLAVTNADFSLLVSQLDTKQTPISRLAAAQCLASFLLNDEQLRKLTTLIPTAGALEAPQLLAAFEKCKNDDVGTALVHALLESKVAKSIPPATLRAALSNFPSQVLKDAQPLLKQSADDDAARAKRLAELEPLLHGGDPSRGQGVFLSKTAACTTCHTITGAGGHVGPDLSKIGSIRAGRDLLESIVFPSASIARGFESFVVETTDGKIYAGPLAGESATSLRLKTPAEVIIPRSQIKVLRPERISIMPQGLDAQLSKQELSDLLAFLQACR